MTNPARGKRRGWQTSKEWPSLISDLGLCFSSRSFTNVLPYLLYRHEKELVAPIAWPDSDNTVSPLSQGMHSCVCCGAHSSHHSRCLCLCRVLCTSYCVRVFPSVCLTDCAFVYCLCASVAAREGPDSLCQWSPWCGQAGGTQFALYSAVCQKQGKPNGIFTWWVHSHTLPCLLHVTLCFATVEFCAHNGKYACRWWAPAAICGMQAIMKPDTCFLQPSAVCTLNLPHWSYYGRHQTLHGCSCDCHSSFVWSKHLKEETVRWWLCQWEADHCST